MRGEPVHHCVLIPISSQAPGQPAALSSACRPGRGPPPRLGDCPHPGRMARLELDDFCQVRPATAVSSRSIAACLERLGALHPVGPKSNVGFGPALAPRAFWIAAKCSRSCASAASAKGPELAVEPRLEPGPARRRRPACTRAGARAAGSWRPEPWKEGERIAESEQPADQRDRSKGAERPRRSRGAAPREEATSADSSSHRSIWWTAASTNPLRREPHDGRRPCFS